MTYTGPIYRGVDYNPTWPGWTATKNTQFEDSDFFNDAFASLWGSKYYAAPGGSGSKPVVNSNYRDDLLTMANDGFNLVRLYNWGPNRDKDHLNFLEYANNLKMGVVVPVSDYFLGNDQYAWGNGKVNFDANYSFASAPEAMQTDFKQFIKSITDPVTQKIHTAVQSIAVGNEGDIGELIRDWGVSASDYLARTNWWIVNLHRAINGASSVNGPDGKIIPITATISNADQGVTDGQPNGTWFKDLIVGVAAGDATPIGWYKSSEAWQKAHPGDVETSFSAAVTGLATADPGFESYYYNSVNIGQNGTGIKATLGLYDQGASPWPGGKYNVPLLLMEVFTADRNDANPAAQVAEARERAQALEEYLAANKAGTADSQTNLMGYNYFEFNDEPSNGGKKLGLYQVGDKLSDGNTGVTKFWYGGQWDNKVFPIYSLVKNADLVSAWTSGFPNKGVGALDGNNDAYMLYENQPLGLETSVSVLRNDVPGSSARLVSAPEHGALLFASDGTFGYTPEAGFSGLDSFVYGTDNGTSSSYARALLYVVPTLGDANPTLDLLSLTAQQQVALTYTALLGRAADAPGFQFWVDQFDAASPSLSPSVLIAGIAGSFGSSSEAKGLYPFLANPKGATDDQINSFLDSVYNNLFNRSPDANGLAYWKGLIEHTVAAGKSPSSIVMDIISGAQVGADTHTLMGKVAVGLEFVRQQETLGTLWNGAADNAAATALLRGVSSDPESVLIGINQAEALITAHA